jgi:alpha-ribazole phosphatase
MALILLRHLAPAGGAGVCYGRSDLAPGPDLAAGARAIAARVPQPARIVTSPLSRCRCLAGLLGHRLRVPVWVDPDWREIDFGAWEGLAWDAVPRRELDAWAADLFHARPHGGESVAMLLARTRRALRRTRPGTLVVTHAGSIRAALVAGGAGAAGWNRRIRHGEAVSFPGAPRVAHP